MRAGDRLIVEANIEHQAAAVDDSEVLDVFVPCRRDYAQ
jgi:quercetin dioxygenase-like cupin family protein